MNLGGSDLESAYGMIVEEFLQREGVTVGAGKGFGAGALKVGGKIFALFSSKGQFVVKLPKARVAKLVADGRGEPFDTGRGTPMKEWVAVLSGADWHALAEEAYKHGGGQ